MKKYKILYSLFMFIGAIILILFFNFYVFFIAYAIPLSYGNPTRYGLIYLAIMGIISVPLVCYIELKILLQITVIDQRGIRVQSLLGLLQDVTWDEIKEIRFEVYNLSSPGTARGYFLVVSNDIEKRQVTSKIYSVCEDGILIKDTDHEPYVWVEFE